MRLRLKAEFEPKSEPKPKPNTEIEKKKKTYSQGRLPDSLTHSCIISALFCFVS